VDADGDGHAVGLLALDALDVNNELLAVHLHGEGVHVTCTFLRLPGERLGPRPAVHFATLLIVHRNRRQRAIPTYITCHLLQTTLNAFEFHSPYLDDLAGLTLEPTTGNGHLVILADGRRAASTEQKDKHSRNSTSLIEKITITVKQNPVTTHHVLNALGPR
jgi:hypothetical protein